MQILKELGIVLGITCLSELISRALPFYIPTAIVGMFVLLILLRSRLLKEAQIAGISAFLSDNMAFFFLPASVNILASYDRIRGIIPALLLVCLVSTLATFAVAYGVSYLAQRLLQKEVVR